MSYLPTLSFRDRNLVPIWEKVRSAERLTLEDGMAMFNSSDLLGLGKMAHAVQRAKSGDAVYFVVNRQVNPSNICVLACKFCDFAAKRGDADAYEMTMEEILSKLSHEQHEVHIVGGLHPEWPWEFYINMMRQIKSNFPNLDIKAWTAVEIHFFAKKFRLTIEEVLRQLKGAGLTTMPGGGAEVFSERVRKQLFNNKIGEKTWMEVHDTAHRLGIPTNATMLYGHIETIEERVNHMLKLRAQQDKSSGFLTFIPLAYQPGANGVRDRYTSAVDDLRTIAVSRLMLDNFPHIKSYWIMLTAEVAPVALQFGADDMDGTVGEERIAHAAAATSPIKLAKENIIKLIRSAGKVPVQRDIMYRPLEIHDKNAVGKIPYLNCVPFYENFERKPFRLVPLTPSQMGKLAESKQIDAGPLSLMDFWRVEKEYEMLDYGIAVKNMARSVTLYSNFHWEELQGRRIGITADTSTSIELLKVLLVHRYAVSTKLERLHPIFQAQEAAYFDAVLVIGDEALMRSKAGLANFQFAFDLGKEWHEWTKLPFVFAVWAIRRDAEAATKEALIAQLDSTVTSMPFTITEFAKWHGKRLELTPAEVQVYLNGFVYRLGEKEKEAIEKFRDFIEAMPVRDSTSWDR